MTIQEFVDYYIDSIKSEMERVWLYQKYPLKQMAIASRGAAGSFLIMFHLYLENREKLDDFRDFLEEVNFPRTDPDILYRALVSEERAFTNSIYRDNQNHTEARECE